MTGEVFILSGAKKHCIPYMEILFDRLAAAAAIVPERVGGARGGDTEYSNDDAWFSASAW